MSLSGPHMHLPFKAPSATTSVTFAAETRRGRSKAINEDHYLVMRIGRHQETLLTSLPDELVRARFDEYGYGMVVADGIGEDGSGEAASHLAIATLLYLVRQFGKWNVRIDDTIAREIMERAERFWRHVDGTVAYERLHSDSHTNQTTLTATFGAGTDLFVAHVGHSRAYLFRRGSLMRLTRDQTYRRRRPVRTRLGPVADINRKARDFKHVLSDTLGMAGPVGPTIDLERVRLEDGDEVLTCTNGLTDVLDDDMIAEILGMHVALDDQCRALVDMAAATGEDDVTAILARYQIPN